VVEVVLIVVVVVEVEVVVVVVVVVEVVFGLVIRSSSSIWISCDSSSIFIN
jgi:hypothetical protein